MSQVFVKGYMKAHGHVRGYTRRQTRKARVILNKLNRRNEKNILLHGNGNMKVMSKIQRDNQRGRRIINKYF